MFEDTKNNYLRKYTAWVSLVTFISGILFTGPGAAVFAQSKNVNSKEYGKKYLWKSDSPYANSGSNYGEAFVGGSKGGKDALEEDNLIVKSARIAVRRDALASRTKIYGHTLEGKDLPPMKQGMTNVTAEVEGFEFLPHGTKFKTPVEIYLPYDPKFIPKDMSEESLFSYYYDEEQLQWVRLDRVEVDRKNHFVISRSNHFTKMVNATLKLPESPQALAFNPNSLKDIKAADPSAGITMIEPPKASSNGTNNLNFPIEVPPGRAGMQPQLAISYNSGGSNGWLGVGWDLSVPSITHDTKFGVPNYDGNDKYLLNGQELIEVERPRSDLRKYVMRVEGQFQRIYRHGDSPDNYFWEVTDKNGNTTYYGKNADSKVQSNRNIKVDFYGNGTSVDLKPIFQWNISTMVDLNNNCVKYDYVNHELYTSDNNKINAVEVYLKTIKYTGTYSNDTCTGARYSVSFDSGERGDEIYNARSKFKVISTKRLNNIKVYYDNGNTEDNILGALVRKYVLSYHTTDNTFNKNILENISVLDSSESPFYNYQFQYEEMNKSDDQMQGFAGVDSFDHGVTKADIGDDSSVFSDIIALFSQHEAGLSYSKSYSMSMGFSGGLEFTPDTTPHAGANLTVNAGNGGNITSYMIMDINGDNLPDQVIKSPDNEYFSYKQNTGHGFENTFKQYKTVNLVQEDAGPIGQVIHDLRVGLDALNPVLIIVQVAAAILTILAIVIPLTGADGMAYSISSSVNIASGSLLVATVVLDILDETPIVQGLSEYASMEKTITASLGGGANLSLGVGKSVPKASIGASESFSDSESVISFSDVNGDGLVDQIVKTTDGKLHYKINDPYGNDGNGSIEEGAFCSPAVSGSFLPEDKVNKIKERFFFTEAVKRWTAPKSGVIQVNGRIKKLQKGGDGVRLRIRHEKVTISQDYLLNPQTNERVQDSDGNYMQAPLKHFEIKNNAPLWEKELGGDDDKYHAHSIEVKVDKGDSITFRVSSKDDLDNDTVEWLPEISYIDSDNSRESEEYGCDPAIDERCQSLDRGKEQGLTNITDKDRRYKVARNNGVNLAKYGLQNENFYSMDDFYLMGSRNQIDSDGNLIDNNIPKSEYDYYTDDGYPNAYRGWEYEEWNYTADKYVSYLIPRLDGNRYVGGAGKDTYLTRSQMNPSRVGGKKAIELIGDTSVTPTGNTTAPVCTANNPTAGIIRKSLNNTGGANMNLVGFGGSYSTGTTGTNVEWVDLNGDRYPDLLIANPNGFKVAFNNHGHGLGGIHDYPNAQFGIRISNDSSLSISGGSGPIVNYISSRGGIKQSKSDTAGGADINGGLSFSQSKSAVNLMDINGDGLPDQIRKESGNIYVRLNYGDGFSETEEKWSVGAITLGNRITEFMDNPPAALGDLEDKIAGPGVGDALNYSTTFSLFGGAGFSTPPILKSNVAASAGVNSNTTSSKSFLEIMDINGDGLSDIVYKKHGQPFMVSLNYGSRFGSFLSWHDPAWKVNNVSVYSGPDTLTYSQSTSQNANASISIPFPITIPATPPPLEPNLRIDASPSVGASMTYSKSELSFQDINGDGLPDHIFKGSDSSKLYAKLNKSGKVNLLKQVDGPLGMSMKFTYERKGNTVENPNSQYVLKDYTVINSHSTNKDNASNKDTCSSPVDCKEELTTTFEYTNGQYDRNERTPYGFATVKETRPDGTYTVTNYLNGYDDNHAPPQSGTDKRAYLNYAYYTKGLAVSRTNYKSDNTPYYEEYTNYEFKPVHSSSDLRELSLYPSVKNQTFVYIEGNNQKTNEVTYEYDDFGNVQTELDKGDNNDNNDSTFLTIGYSDNQQLYIVGKPTSVEVTDEQNNTLRKRTADYDSNGNLVTFSAYSNDNTISTSTLTYYPNGNIHTLEGPNQYTLTYEYETKTYTQVSKVSDSFGLNSESDNFDYRFGVAQTTIDTNGNHIEYEYDAKGRMSKVWGPYLQRGDLIPSLSMHYSPDAADGVPKAWTQNREDHDSNRTIDTMIYIDSLKRVIQTMKTSEVYQGSSTKLGRTITGKVIFDVMGRVVSQSQPVFRTGDINNNTSFEDTPELNATTFKYDDQGRTIEVVTPDQGKTTTEYSIENGWMKTRVKDPEQNLPQNLSKNLYKDSYADLYSKIREIHEKIGTKEIATRYTYSPVGEILEVIDDNGNKTTVDYDWLGRRLAINNPDSGLTTFKYDLAGNLVEKITASLAAKGKSIKYEYQYNRLMKIDHPGHERDVYYTYGDDGASYNRAGRIVKIDDESGITELYYGSLGEVVQTDKTIIERKERDHDHEEYIHEKNGEKNKSQNENSNRGRNSDNNSNRADGRKDREHHEEHEKFVTKQTWDSFGRMKQLTYPDGEVLTYTYDAGGLLQKASGKKNSKTIDYLKMLGYDEFGQRVFMEFGNKTQTRYTYDEKTRRLNTLEMKSESRQIQSISYQYDLVGNVLSIKDSALNPVEQSFQYDDLYRLVAAEGSYQRKMQQHNHLERDQQYDSDHGEAKLHKYEQTFAYDNIHNMIRKTSVNKVQEVEGSRNHWNFPKENNYIYDYSYTSNRPHAVSQIKISGRPKDHGEHGDQGRQGYGHHHDEDSVINFDYDESGNLIVRDLDKDEGEDQSNGRSSDNSASHRNDRSGENGNRGNNGNGHGEEAHKRNLRWDSENRLKAVWDHGKLTTFRYNANGERVVKRGNKGETIYVNQFYEVRDDKAIFKHIFAGNTRIATKILAEREKEHKGSAGQSREVLQGQVNTNDLNMSQLNTNGNVNTTAGTNNRNSAPVNSTNNGNSQNSNRNSAGNNNANTTHENQSSEHRQNNSDHERQNRQSEHDQQRSDRENASKRKSDERRNQYNEDHNRSHENQGNHYGQLKNGNNGNGNNNAVSETDQSAQSTPVDNTTQTSGNKGNSGNSTAQNPVNISNPNSPRDKNNRAENNGHREEKCGHDDHGYRGTMGHHDDFEECVYYYHGDHLGSSNYITDEDGRVFEHTLNLPYGEIWIDEGSDTSLLGYKFTGKELDEETGYYYFGARYYDPQVSMWIGTDPAFPEYMPEGKDVYFPEKKFDANKLKGSGGVYNSKNLNIYNYTSQNPVNNFDPDGNFSAKAAVKSFMRDFLDLFIDRPANKFFQSNPAINDPPQNVMGWSGCLFRTYQALAEDYTGRNMTAGEIRSSKAKLQNTPASYNPNIRAVTGNMTVNDPLAVINDALDKLGSTKKAKYHFGQTANANYTILQGTYTDAKGEDHTHFMLGDSQGQLVWDPANGGLPLTDVHVKLSIELYEE